MFASRLGNLWAAGQNSTNSTARKTRGQSTLEESMAKPDENSTRHMIPVRTLCPISIKLPPLAVCTLSAVGDDAGSGLTVVADSRGDAEIFARAEDATPEPLRLEIHEASGRRSGRVVEIQAGSDPGLRRSFATRPRHRSAGRADLALPAATRHELEQLSAADLLQRGGAGYHRIRAS